MFVVVDRQRSSTTVERPVSDDSCRGMIPPMTRLPWPTTDWQIKLGRQISGRGVALKLPYLSTVLGRALFTCNGPVPSGGTHIHHAILMRNGL